MPCAVARAIPAPLELSPTYQYQQQQQQHESQPLLVGVDNSGVLWCGARTVATGVRSFGVHWSAPGGALAAGAEAPEVSFAAAGAAAAAWSGPASAAAAAAATPRVVYATLADELRVVELPDLIGAIGSGIHAAGSGGGGLGGDQDGGLVGVGVSQMASAAGGKRAGGGVHQQEGVYMDQLHVWLGTSSASCFPRHQKCACQVNIRASTPRFFIQVPPSDVARTSYSICPHYIMLATSSTARYP